MTSPIRASQYLSAALDVAQTAATSQLDQVELAAERIAAALMNGRQLWAFGTGHSHLLVEELWGRAGGLTDVRPILEPSLMLHEGLQKSSLLERQSGLADVIAQLHPIGDGDCVIVISNSGRNAVPVEFALAARDRGATVIACTSRTHSASVSSRAPGGQKLYEIADLVIDNCGVPGDAIIAAEPNPVGPTSTVVGALLLNALVVEIVGRLQQAGHPISTLRSLNA